MGIVSRLMRALSRSERGATMIEYAILAALISIVALTAMRTTGSSVNALFTTIANRTTTTPAAHNYTLADFQAVTFTQSGASTVNGNQKTTNYTAANGMTLQVVATASTGVVQESANGPDGLTYYVQAFYPNLGNEWDSRTLTYSGTALATAHYADYGENNAGQTTNYDYNFVTHATTNTVVAGGSVGKPSYLVTPIF